MTKQLDEFDVIKPASSLVRGNAINIAGEHYIVYRIMTTPVENNKMTLLDLKSLNSPDKDQARLTVNSEATFIHNTLYDMDI